MKRLAMAAACGLVFGTAPSYGAGSGTEGSSFLDIPVGAGPAALGSAYSAHASDGYAPVWNPAGLGWLEKPEAVGTHLTYLENVRYEFLSVVVPFGPKVEEGPLPGRRESGFGVSAQYLSSGDLDRRDGAGAQLGTFDATFAAYSLSYGWHGWDALSLGVTGKLIHQKILDATASGYAADLGALYHPRPNLALALVAANLGPDIQFVNEGDPLPTAARAGAFYRWRTDWEFSVEGVYRRTGHPSGQFGMEWFYGNQLSIRGGFNTAHIKELGAQAGLSAGVAGYLWGQELGYAWVPFGELGATHYFSLVLRWSAAPRVGRPRQSGSDASFETMKDEEFGSYDSLYELLSDDEKKAIE